jgi:hypothetical protein
VATNGDARFDPRAQARAASSLISIAIVVLALGAVYSSFAVIKPGNVGVVFNRWSGSLRAAGQGVVWRIPWVTQVQSYPIALRTYSMVARSGEGSAQGDDSIDLPTREGQHIRQDISVTYNTSEDKAANVFRSFRGADIEDIEQVRGRALRNTLIVLGITGASGAPYAIRLLEMLVRAGRSVHVTMSPAAVSQGPSGRVTLLSVMEGSFSSTCRAAITA